MTFRERSTVLMLAILVGVYGGYFFHIYRMTRITEVSEIAYQPLLLVMVLALVAVSVIGHIIITMLPSYEGDQSDERDTQISLNGGRVGGIVLAVGTLSGLFLAMAEFPAFWIAHALLAGLVLAELASGAVKLFCYRRMA